MNGAQHVTATIYKRTKHVVTHAGSTKTSPLVSASKETHNDKHPRHEGINIMRTNTRIYKVLDWIDTTARAMPFYTQIIALFVLLGSAFVLSLWLTHIIPYLLVGVW